MFQNRSIRHIQMGIRHMWRVANRLDNAAVEQLVFISDVGCCQTMNLPAWLLFAQDISLLYTLIRTDHFLRHDKMWRMQI